MLDDWFSTLAHVFCSCFMILLCGLKGSLPAVFGFCVAGSLLDLGPWWLDLCWMWSCGPLGARFGHLDTFFGVSKHTAAENTSVLLLKVFTAMGSSWVHLGASWGILEHLGAMLDSKCIG